MFSGDSKRVVVIKDIPSNIIEEAIFILKPEFLKKGGTSSKKQLYRENKNRNEFMLKEAELIINNYIKDANAFLESSKKKPGRESLGPRRKFSLNTVINSVLIGSILLLVFMISKLF